MGWSFSWTKLPAPDHFAPIAHVLEASRGHPQNLQLNRPARLISLCLMPHQFSQISFIDIPAAQLGMQKSMAFPEKGAEHRYTDASQYTGPVVSVVKEGGATAAPRAHVPISLQYLPSNSPP